MRDDELIERDETMTRSYVGFWRKIDLEFYQGSIDFTMEGNSAIQLAQHYVQL